DINAHDSAKYTPLMWAATSNNKELVQLLLDKGADKALIDVSGKNAAQIAQQNGHKDLVVLLDGVVKGKVWLWQFLCDLSSGDITDAGQASAEPRGRRTQSDSEWSQRHERPHNGANTRTHTYTTHAQTHIRTRYRRILIEPVLVSLRARRQA